MNSSENITLLALHAAELQELAAKEVKEYSSLENQQPLGQNAQLFECSATQCLKFLEKARSFQVLTVLCAKGANSEALEWKGLETVLGPAVERTELSFSVKVFAMQGNERRISLQQKIHPQITQELESLGYLAKLDYKNPRVVFRIYYDEKNYYVGLQIHTDDLDGRAYRVFSHKASFRGDFAQLLLHSARVNSAKHVTICPARDGVLAIEAVLAKEHVSVYPIRKDTLLRSIPLFATLVKSSVSSTHKDSTSIIAIEAQGRNQRALRSNVKRAKLEKSIRVLHTNVENAVSVIDPCSQDLIIVHFTKKDETRLNDYLYFFRSVLQPGGRVFLISRTSYEVELTSEFSLLSSQQCQWKGSNYLLSEFKKQ